MTQAARQPDRAPFALGANDPDPVEVMNRTGSSDFVITCEHAGRAIPAHLGDMGLDEQERQRHIAWDIGIDGLGRALATALDAPVIFQPYSRLVIDCNRPAWAEDAIPEVSDGTEVPANRALQASEREARVASIHTPFHDMVADILNEREASGKRTAVIALHSFTPSLRARPAPRPWHLGILFNRDSTLSEHVHAAMEHEAGHLTFTYNEPYVVEDHGDYTIPVHGEKRGLPHSLFEIRNDRICDAAGQAEWCDLLCRVLPRAAARLWA
jgi:predicted N-formylglutamate amidohydrolase